MSYQIYPCVCTPSVVIPSPPCDNCLQIPSVIIDPLTAPAPCGVVAVVDIGTLSTLDVCTGTINWSILSFDEDAFTSVTISAAGVVTLTTADTAVGGQEYTIIGKGACSNSIHSRQFFIKLIVQDLCFNIDCVEGEETCNPCTGDCDPIPPVINVGVD